METSTVIRVGRGSFNDFVIDQTDVQLEHCHIIYDDKGIHIYRVHRDSAVFINNKEMENRYADITPDDEVRVGATVIPITEKTLEKKNEEPPQCPYCGGRNVVFKTIIARVRWALFFLFFLAIASLISFIFIDTLSNSIVFVLIIVVIPVVLSLLLSRQIVCSCRDCGTVFNPEKEFYTETSTENKKINISHGNVICCPECGSKLVFERAGKSLMFYIIASIVFAVFLVLFFVFGANSLKFFSIISSPVGRIFLIFIVTLLTIKIPEMILPQKGNKPTYKCRKCEHVFGDNNMMKNSNKE